MQMGFGPGWSRLCTYLLCMTLKKKKVFSQSRAYTSFPRCFSSAVCGLPSATQPRRVSHGSLWKWNAAPPPQIVPFSHLHRVVWYNQIHSEWAWGECMQRQPFINWLLLKKKKVLERLLWEFHLLSLCRRPLELLRGEELHWSCSKKVNAKPTTRTRATGFTLHQKTLPLTLRNCRTHPSGISNVKYTQRNHRGLTTHPKQRCRNWQAPNSVQR